MQRPQPHTAAAFLLVLVTMTAAPALAQPVGDPRAVGPYRGLFGGNEWAENSRHLFDVVFGGYGGYDDDVTKQAGSAPGDPTAQASSSYAGAAANLRYLTNAFQRVKFRAEGQVAGSYYPDLDDLVATSHGASATLEWTPTPRTSMSLRHRFRFSPFFGYSIYGATDLPEGNPPGGAWSDTRVIRSENYTNDTAVSVGRRLSERSAVSADAQFRRTDFAESGAGYADTRRWGAGARWTYRVTEHASARLGYGYRSGEYSGDLPGATGNGVHLIDAGVDYGRALSFSRRTRLSFGMGTSGYAQTSSDAQGTVEDFRYTVIGDAQLTHEIGQSWAAAAFFSRRVRFYDGFADPFLTNAAALSVGGYVGARVRLSLVAGTDWGEYGDVKDGNRDTRSTYVSPVAQFALTRNIAAQATYYYYRYHFDQGVPSLPEGFLPRYSRQGFRVGLSVWVPLISGGAAP
jgi:hypothetical protein